MGRRPPRFATGPISASTSCPSRTRFAEAYDEPEVTNLLVRSGLTWLAILNGLPRARLGRGPSGRLASEPTKATLADADRAEKLLARPEVAAELLARDKDNVGARQAQAAAERREREAARRQKEADQRNQEVERALRLRLVHGDKDWENLAEQLEIWGDTAERWVDSVDSLTVPDSLRLKVLERHLSKLQERLFRLRNRLFPVYQASLGIDEAGVIEAQIATRE